MIQKFLEISTEQRLNNILDKIFKGIKVSNDEKMFLDSFKSNQEEYFNDYLNKNSKIYLSDNGHFKFIFKDYQEQDDCKIISGTLIISDPVIDGLAMRSNGNILIFGTSHVALDFRINEIDIFELTCGKEEELDDFIYEIIDDKL
jgi:hypothetical protein